MYNICIICIICIIYVYDCHMRSEVQLKRRIDVLKRYLVGFTKRQCAKIIRDFPI